MDKDLVIALWVLVGFVVAVAITWVFVVVSAYLEAYAEFKSRPREPMDWCPKHGYFRQKYSLPIPGVPTVRMCPSCFYHSLSESVKEPTIEAKK